MFVQESVLITGGTGSLGRALTKHIVRNFPAFKRLVIFSRDEQKQFEMAQQYPEASYPNMRFFVGDVRDFDRLQTAFQDIDIVIHAAAMKHVPIAEYNPMECIKTNILGAENVIRASLATGVRRVVALSTDKASAPINLYGATKLVSDKLFSAANNIAGKRDIIFSVVRYGNVLGSNGSVLPFFLQARERGVLPITDPNMTRFNISLDHGVEMVLCALKNALGGEIFVPKIPSFKVVDLAEAVDPSCEKQVVGIRPGEKLHEEMITPSDSYYTYDIGSYYVIAPFQPHKWKIEDFIERFKAKKVAAGFHYSSEKNDQWESVNSLRRQIQARITNSAED